MSRAIRKLWWKFAHNAVAHPWVFLAEVVGLTLPAASRFHDWTAARAWPPPVDEVERRLEAWERLREAEEAAETCGYEALSDAIGLLAMLWAAGFEGEAERVLAGVAAPLLSGRSAGTDEPAAGIRALREVHLSPSKTILPALFFLSVLLAPLSPPPAGAGSAYQRPAWRDDDHDCQSTRVEVMVRTCREVKLSANKCRVLQATCLDAYSGAEVATDTPAQALHVDHVFPASVAWKRRSWTAAAFADFFNDQRNLLVVRARTNLRKGNRMPQEWCPAGRGARLLAAKRFRRISRAYGLRLLPAEEAGLRTWEAGGCAAGAVVL